MRRTTWDKVAKTGSSSNERVKTSSGASDKTNYIPISRMQTAQDSATLKHLLKENLELKHMVKNLATKFDISLDEQRRFREMVEERLNKIEDSVNQEVMVSKTEVDGAAIEQEVDQQPEVTSSDTVPANPDISSQIKIVRNEMRFELISLSESIAGIHEALADNGILRRRLSDPRRIATSRGEDGPVNGHASDTDAKPKHKTRLICVERKNKLLLNEQEVQIVNPTRTPPLKPRFVRI